jgi:hypothetical protein
MNKQNSFFYRCLLNVAFVIIACNTSLSQEDSDDAAANAANPLAFVTKFQVQPNFTWKDDKARQINLTSRIIQPTTTIGLPFSGVKILQRFIRSTGWKYPSSDSRFRKIKTWMP